MARTKPIDFRLRKNQALRAEIYRRDRFTCQSCGWKAANVPPEYSGRFTIGAWPYHDARLLHVDHITPRVQGGLSTAANLQTLCEACNCRKAGA